MTTFNVLIPLDGSGWSREVLPHVRRLFNPAEHQLVLLRVADEPVGVTGAPPRLEVVNSMFLPAYQSEPETDLASHPIYASRVRETTHAELMDELQDGLRELQGIGFTVSAKVQFGDPAAEIICAVEKQAIDIVIMATHGRTGLRRLAEGHLATDCERLDHRRCRGV